jgi:hypothetical protein
MKQTCIEDADLGHPVEQLTGMKYKLSVTRAKAASTSDMHQSYTLTKLGEKSIKSQVSVLSGLTSIQQKVHQPANTHCC